MSTPFDPNSAGQQNDPYNAGYTGQPGGAQDPYAQGSYGAGQGAYGSQPNAYGSQQAAYGQQAYGQPTYGSQPGAQSYGQPTYGQPAYATVTAEDPGQTLGIVALVMAFVFPIAGIILGVMSRNKSREAGLPDNTVGKWGLILSIVFVALGVVGVVLYIVFIVVMVGMAGAASTYDSSLLSALF